MLVYKYHDVFSLLRTKQRCADCKVVNDCYWHKPKKNPMMEACGEIKHDYRNPEVSPSNANWLLFQIGRDVEMSKNVIIQRNNNVFLSMMSPLSARTNHLPDFDESKIYIDILESFLKVIVKFEKETKGKREEKVLAISRQKTLISNEEDAKKKMQLEAKLRKLESDLLSMDSTISRFVGSIIETTLKVKGKDVAIFSEGEDFFDAVKKVTDACNYNLYRTKNPEEARAWLGQITNAN